MTEAWISAREGAAKFGYSTKRSFREFCATHRIPRKQGKDKNDVLYSLGAITTAKQDGAGAPVPYKGLMTPEQEELIQKSKDSLIKQLLEERTRTMALVEACESAVLKLKIPTVRQPKVHSSMDKTEEMHLLLSDVQAGQFVEPRTVGGLSRYSFQIFAERLDRLGEKLVLFHDLFSKTRKINKLVIHWLGDIVEGTQIYRGQPFYIDRIAVDQVFDSTGYFVQFLTKMATVFPEVENMMVWGNHGRVGRKGENHVRDNWDYVMYRVLRMAMRGQGNVKCHIAESPFMVVQHGTKNFFLTHGDQVKSWMNIPFYGLDRMSRKLTGLTGTNIHYLQVGHHHRDATASIPRGRWMVNGSFVGGSLLSIDALQEADFPKQIMYMFHHREGIHSVSDLRLAEDMELHANERGIYTPVVENVI